MSKTISEIDTYIVSLLDGSAEPVLTTSIVHSLAEMGYTESTIRVHLKQLEADGKIRKAKCRSRDLRMVKWEIAKSADAV